MDLPRALWREKWCPVPVVISLTQRWFGSVAIHCDARLLPSCDDFVVSLSDATMAIAEAHQAGDVNTRRKC